MKKQKVNHARSKQRRKALRLRNRIKSIIEKRVEKLRKMRKPKGQTLILPNNTLGAKDFAVPIEKLFPDGGGGWMFDHGHRKNLNQRQRRKLFASNPHLRKKK